MKHQSPVRVPGLVFHRRFKVVVVLQVQFGEKSQRQLSKAKVTGKSAVWSEEVSLCVLSFCAMPIVIDS